MPSLPQKRDIPALSFIILTPDSYASIAKTLHHIAQQSVANQIEVVIVAPSREGLGAELPVAEAVQSVQVVEIGAIHSIATARAEGISVAKAPIIAIGENHSYPEPGWGEALLKAHQGPWAGVGAAIANVNPTPTSWAQLFATYGRWAYPVEAGEIDDLPGHNSSYKKEVLLAQGDRLSELMEAEIALHQRLREQGHKLYMDPGVVTRHINLTRFGSIAEDHLMLGRLWASAETHRLGLSSSQRMLRALMSLGAVFRRMQGPLGEALKPARRSQYSLGSVIPLLWLTMVIRVIGEALGFLFGAGEFNTLQRTIEFEREKHLATDAERKIMETYG